MRLLALVCRALERRFRAAAEASPHDITLALNPQGLHNQPPRLRDVLQAQIDAVPPGRYDALLLVYGLCGAAIHGLLARHTRLVVTRAHDCVTLYLGSRQRYQHLFTENPGTYWYIQDYAESYPGGDLLSPGGSKNRYQEYVEKYGADNADYLMQVLGDWNPLYDRAIFVDTERDNAHDYAAAVQQRAAERGWTYQHEQGSNVLLQRLAEGAWEDDSFLVVPPGHRILQTNDELLLRNENYGQ